MKIKKVLSLSACTVVLIMAASCGQTANSDGRTFVSDQNSVQSVLEQGMAENETDGEIVEDSGPDEAATEDTQNMTQENAAGDDPVADPAAETIDKPGAESAQDIVDLTVLSSTMVYSEVYNMMCYPENYVGKTIKMSGQYSVYHDESTDKYYHACIIMDATACCSQGIEFELTDDYKYPDDYPELCDQICVIGTFETYQEGEGTYCTLRNAKRLE
jgi:uncharacterized membrane protein YcgQ (UPF0703/DUF1980 family)